MSAGQAAPALGQLDSTWMPTLAPGSEATSDKSLLTLNLIFSFCKENRIYRDASLLGFKIIIFMGCEFYVSLSQGQCFRMGSIRCLRCDFRRHNYHT